MKIETLHASHGRELTPSERQIILRRLKHGPSLDRQALADYAVKVKDQVVKKRKQVDQ
jgi:hypothetical protein